MGTQTANCIVWPSRTYSWWQGTLRTSIRERSQIREETQGESYHTRRRVSISIPARSRAYGVSQKLPTLYVLILPTCHANILIACIFCCSAPRIVPPAKLYTGLDIPPPRCCLALPSDFWYMSLLVSILQRVCCIGFLLWLSSSSLC